MRENRNENGEIEIDLREIFYLLKKKLLVIIITALVFAMGAGVLSYYVINPQYSSTSKIYVLTQSTSITSIADIQTSSSLATDYLELIKSRPVVMTVIGNLNLNMGYDIFLSKLTVTNPEETRILNITVTDENPRIAKEIANELSQVSRKQISEIMKTDEPTVVERAIASSKPTSPDKKRNICVGFLLGLLLSALIVIVRHIMDDTIKNQEDVEKYLGLITLANIPYRDELNGKKHKSKKKKRGSK